VSFIETYTGRTIDPIDPHPGEIDIQDIAHALSMQCRFSGHCRVHYSVAEHSVRVSEYLEDAGASKEVCLWGLLHDASEAYLVDLPRPLKEHTELGRAYREAESHLQAVICRRFGLSEKQPAIVHVADDALLATEVRDLMRGDRPYWAKIRSPSLPDRIRPWKQSVAESEFLLQFHALGGINV
jgi:hypothetical protein